MIKPETMAHTLVESIALYVQEICDTMAKPNGSDWDIRKSGIEHARRVNLARNEYANGRASQAAFVLGMLGIDVVVNKWVGPNQLTGIDAHNVIINGVRLEDREAVDDAIHAYFEEARQ